MCHLQQATYRPCCKLATAAGVLGRELQARMQVEPDSATSITRWRNAYVTYSRVWPALLCALARGAHVRIWKNHSGSYG